MQKKQNDKYFGTEGVYDFFWNSQIPHTSHKKKSNKIKWPPAPAEAPARYGPHSAPPAGRRLRPGLPPPPGCTRLNLPAYPACSLRSAAAPAVMAAYRRRRWVPVPEPKPSREEMIETYLQTLAKVVGRYNEIRAISCRRVGFLCNWVPQLGCK